MASQPQQYPAIVGDSPVIRSGEWRDLPGIADYFAGLVDDILIERVVWAEAGAADQMGGLAAAEPGHIWYRFWLWRDDQLVERYYDAEGVLLGTQIDICSPMVIEESQWQVDDLVLDIWISPEGRVNVTNEASFDQAVADGLLTPDQEDYAEQHVRRLTGAIAQRRFPPAIVRNWQVDITRIRSLLGQQESIEDGAL